MLKIRHLLLLIGCLGSSYISMAQATLTGKITDEEGRPIKDASVTISRTDQGTVSDSLGNYTIHIPSGVKNSLNITFVLYEPAYLNNVKINGKDTLIKNVTLFRLDNILQAVEIKDNRSRTQAGMVDISLENVDQNPTPGGGVEGLIKTMVGSHDELTSQYSVRGGNYDENLVYVNDFEIYRPFLVRSGQQEGLSFVNPDLAQGVSFSVGGFQSKYGDKMSSVLDVTYKHPDKFAGSVLLSFLGAQFHL